MLTPEQAVDSIAERFGRHPGHRALHAKGTLCRGSFTAAPEAGALTRAAHMQGQPVDVTVRFSNGSGDPGSPDHAPDVRGMAVSFHLPDGTATDIVSQTAPRFPVRTPDAFIELLHAGAPGPGRLWRLPAFLVKHPGAVAAIRVNLAALKPPASYANCRFYAIHAFKWLDSGGGERWVRYTWHPEDEAGDGGAPERGRDYLQEEIAARLERGPVRFRLELQIAAAGDSVDDPTAEWPDERERVTAGTLDVTGLETERERGGDVLVFDPVRVTDGIETSDDPILHFRPRAYSVSVQRRTGAA